MRDTRHKYKIGDRLHRHSGDGLNGDGAITALEQEVSFLFSNPSYWFRRDGAGTSVPTSESELTPIETKPK